jgi:phosphoenolpyruvate carboxykinase (GTP)
MFEKKIGVDIVAEIGGIRDFESAEKLFKNKMDSAHFQRISQIRNQQAIFKIANSIAMCDPDSVFINTGSEADRQFIREISLKNGEEAKLAMENHTVHFDLKEEQGRIVDRTFYIANDKEMISSLANQMNRKKALDEIRRIMTGIMNGKIMIVGFYLRGPVGSPVSNPALEITSSAYVTHSAELLYRNIFDVFDGEVDRLDHFFTNIHSEGLNRSQDLIHARVFMDRSHWTTYSMNCTYAGNTLLLKKGNHRFSVDKAVYENRGKELAEHMFITGIKGSAGRMTWFAGAAPSGCGKTTTAMAGDQFIGDDLAQMWIADDGSVRSVNPEIGIFGIVEDVNWDGDPELMKVLRKPGAEVIWSNVLVDKDDVPHWTGNGEKHPDKGVNFQGEWWEGKNDEKGNPIPVSHPNARCTLSSKFLNNYSEHSETLHGVEIRVITYSGRDSDTMPPVWVAETADEGVVIGACIVSAATATEVGATGIKRAPWANAPFIPGALGDYMDSQFRFFNSPKIHAEKRPIMAGLNYFLTDQARGGSSSNLLGEKKDVKVWLTWLEGVAYGEINFIPSPVGFLPEYEDLKKLFKKIIHKDYIYNLYQKQFSLYVDKIIARVHLQLESYRKEPNIPERLFEVLNKQKEALLCLKERFGPIVTPDQLNQYKA